MPTGPPLTCFFFLELYIVSHELIRKGSVLLDPFDKCLSNVVKKRSLETISQTRLVCKMHEERLLYLTCLVIVFQNGGDTGQSRWSNPKALRMKLCANDDSDDG
eukprot:scaffold4833_cov233-Amphora_coffeaeformis.AAC.1